MHRNRTRVLSRLVDRKPLLPALQSAFLESHQRQSLHLDRLGLLDLLDQSVVDQALSS